MSWDNRVVWSEGTFLQPQHFQQHDRYLEGYVELRARARRDQVRATGRAISSIDRLFEASGATALNNDAPVQRFWRDAHAGRVHAANDPERAYLIFGNNEFGLPPQDTMV